MTRGKKIALVAGGVAGLSVLTYLLAKAKPVKAGGVIASLQKSLPATPFANQSGLVARFSNNLAEFLNFGAVSAPPVSPTPAPGKVVTVGGVDVTATVNAGTNAVVKGAFDWLTGRG